MLRYWFVIFSSCWLMASGQVADTTLAASGVDPELPRVRKQVLNPRLYWDIGKTALLWTEFEEKYEAGVELLWFEHIQLIGEAGMAKLQPGDAYQNCNYTTEGNYFRVGIGYLANVDLRSKIGLGVRYARASFEDELEITINSTSGLNEPYDEMFRRSSLGAQWVEFVLNSEKYMTLSRKNPESKINELLSFGFLFRYRVMIEYDDFNPIEVYAIPGFGRTLNNTVPAINLFIKVNLF